MALTVTGKLVRDVRLDAGGVPSAGGQLRLRGETVTVHRDYAELVTAKPARGDKRPARKDKQALPPATKTE